MDVENRFQGLPPGHMPGQSMPFGFMMPGSYPMQGMWGGPAGMGPMPNLPVAPGQQDLPFGMPYGPISMAYTYPYTSASPAMMYSQAMASGGFPYPIPASLQQMPAGRPAVLSPGAAAFHPGHWPDGGAWQ
ncbi:hypothetical protein WJX84_000510 [Apatococcus fuscideae]|uniref:Uncharacterized protein n=1 Tax=Apatococcus fuscideae TaxID=2026836 RepID=A0AAW1TI01_9CHLO